MRSGRREGWRVRPFSERGLEGEVVFGKAAGEVRPGRLGQPPTGDKIWYKHNQPFGAGAFRRAGFWFWGSADKQPLQICRGVVVA